jgi:hypothetical protein
MNQTACTFPAPELESGVFHTVTGRRVDLNSPTPSMYNPIEAAWSLSRLNRWGGHLTSDQSVAFHSLQVLLMVLQMGGGLNEQIAALHHDGTESLGMVDLPKGVKMLLPEYEAIEKRLWKCAVAPALGLNYDTVPAIVKAAENKLRAREWSDRFTPPVSLAQKPRFGYHVYQQFCNAHSWLQQLRDEQINNPQSEMVLDADGAGDKAAHLVRLHAQIDSDSRVWPCPPTLLPAALRSAKAYTTHS